MKRVDEQDVRFVEKELLEIFNQIRALRGGTSLSNLPKPPFCSFCGGCKDEVGALAAGLNAHICAACANEARGVLLRGE
jgi:hypothetical protein